MLFADRKRVLRQRLEQHRAHAANEVSQITTRHLDDAFEVGWTNQLVNYILSHPFADQGDEFLVDRLRVQRRCPVLENVGAGQKIG